MEASSSFSSGKLDAWKMPDLQNLANLEDWGHIDSSCSEDDDVKFSTCSMMLNPCHSDNNSENQVRALYFSWN